MESFEDKQYVSALLDVYGELLTERQRTFIALHCNEDLSYGEIAESEDISRQAVHDTIQHGRKSLEKFEEVLRLVENNQKVSGSIPDKSDESKNDSGAGKDVRQLVDELVRMIQDDILYDTGPVKRKLRKLKELVG